MMDQKRTFDALLAEYQELRSEITEIHKHQFQITTAVTLGIVAGFGAWVAFLQSHPQILGLLAALSLAQIALSLDFRLRIMGLSHRVQVIEGHLRKLAGTSHIMRWESEYVPKLFTAAPSMPGLRSKAFRIVRQLCMRTLRGAFLAPLLLLYAVCIAMLWIAGAPDPLYWCIVAVLGLVAALGVCKVVADEIGRRLGDERRFAAKFDDQHDKQR